MQTHSTQSVLDKIITLTSERDLISLEYLLAQSLFELIAPDNITIQQAVKIYHAQNLEKQIFKTTDTERHPQGEPLSAQLKQALVECFQSGKDTIFCEENGQYYTIYPLKNTKNVCVAAIAIEGKINDASLSQTIAMVLNVYQNFTGVIRDNEHDTLTGLLNRKTFEYKINKVLSIMHKKKMRKDDKVNTHYFLAIFDIDHFKKINDEHGHLIGDEVLLTFSQIMRDTFRENDMLFRYGGEEFVGVFECTNPDDIQLVLERFRNKIEDYHFSQVGHVTVSIGYTKIKAFDATLHMIDRADQALYFAKNNGRNQISHHQHLIDRALIPNPDIEGSIEFFN